MNLFIFLVLNIMAQNPLTAGLAIVFDTHLTRGSQCSNEWLRRVRIAEHGVCTQQTLERVQNQSREKILLCDFMDKTVKKGHEDAWVVLSDYESYR